MKTRIKFMNEVKLGIFFILLLAASSVNSQCHARNATAARIVGRPCRRPCFPGRNLCSGLYSCLCDHECGYSCITSRSPCPTPPIIRNIVGIKILRRHSNGSLVPVQSQPFLYNDIVEYKCSAGYSGENSLNRDFCHGNGRWTQTSECLLSCPAYNYAQVQSNNMRCGEKCRTNADCRWNQRCICDGACGRSCVYRSISCGSPPAGHQVRIKDIGEGIKRKIKYSCNSGYYLRSGTPTRRCTGGGTWTGRPVTCERITCPDPRPIFTRTGGFIPDSRRSSYYVGDRLRFRCPNTHTLIGPAVRTCMRDGQWSGLNSVCDLKNNLTRCPHPGFLLNGNLIYNPSDNFTIGSRIVYECDEGFIMFGEEVQECLFFLEWSGGGAPLCKDPRFPFESENVLKNLENQLESSVDARRSTTIGNTGIDVNTNLEVTFIFDLSENVTNDELQDTIEFAETYFSKAAEAGSIRCSVLLFASQAQVRLPPQQCTERLLNTTLNYVLKDRVNINKVLGSTRNTQAALSEANRFIFSSPQENLNRLIFMLINGKHTQGSSPNNFINDLKQQDRDDQFQAYVVAFGSEATEVEAAKELASMAYPSNYFIVNPSIISRSRSRIEKEFSACGQTGDIGDLKRSASIQRVTGGNRAKTGAWPWHGVVSLFDRYVSSSYEILGGAALVNSKWALTAAHLFVDFVKSKGWERNVLVTFGITVLPLRSELPSYAQVFVADEIVDHPEYDSDTFRFDISMIKLGQSYSQVRNSWVPGPVYGIASFTKYVRPVCLPCTENSCLLPLLRKEGILNGGETPAERCRKEADWLLQADVSSRKNFLGAITGFGGTMRHTAYDLVTTSSYLKQGQIQMLSHGSCFRRWAVIRRQSNYQVRAWYSEETMICAIGGNSRRVIDACRGDSGGAFVREVRNLDTGDSCWVQIGIVSWGWGCGQNYTINGKTHLFPGYYASVLSGIDWIKRVIDFCPARDPSSIPAGRRCERRCRKERGCRDKSTTCVCDDVCGLSCIRVESECEKLLLENGYVIGNRTYGSVAAYWCDYGYQLSGEPRRKCQSDGLWSGSSPQCIAARCTETPNTPNNGRKSNNPKGYYEFDDVILFSCDPGYSLVGERRITCQSDGAWSFPAPTCQQREAQCGKPSLPLLWDQRRTSTRSSLVPIQRWPWQVVIAQKYLSPAETFKHFSGGGSLINQQWILTSKNLFQSVNKVAGWTRNFFVILGINYLPLRTNELLPRHAQVYDCERIVIHQSVGEVFSDYDVVLIKVGHSYNLLNNAWIRGSRGGRVIISEYVRPVCLPCSESSCLSSSLTDEGILDGTESKAEKCRKEGEWLSNQVTGSDGLGIVTGFGTSQFQSSINTTLNRRNLKEVLFRVNSDRRCNQDATEINSRARTLQNSVNLAYTPRMLCGVKEPGEKSLCRQDGGNPLVKEITNPHTREKCWVQVGIFSWSWGCDLTYSRGESSSIPFSAFYTRISPLMTWINQVSEESSRKKK